MAYIKKPRLLHRGPPPRVFSGFGQVRATTVIFPMTPVSSPFVPTPGAIIDPHLGILQPPTAEYWRRMRRRFGFGQDRTASTSSTTTTTSTRTASIAPAPAPAVVSAPSYVAPSISPVYTAPAPTYAPTREVVSAPSYAPTPSPLAPAPTPMQTSIERLSTPAYVTVTPGSSYVTSAPAVVEAARTAYVAPSYESPVSSPVTLSPVVTSPSTETYSPFVSRASVSPEAAAARISETEALVARQYDAQRLFTEGAYVPAPLTRFQTEQELTPIKPPPQRTVSVFDTNGKNGATAPKEEEKVKQPVEIPPTPPSDASPGSGTPYFNPLKPEEVPKDALAPPSTGGGTVVAAGIGIGLLALLLLR